MHETRPCAGCGPGNVLGSVDDDLAGARAVLSVRRVDHDVGTNAFEQRTYRCSIANLDTLSHHPGIETHQLRAEESGRTGDVNPHD